MRQASLILCLQLCTSFAAAELVETDIPYLIEAPATKKAWFANRLINSQFDSWTINSSYHYEIINNVNLYVGAELTTDTHNNSGSSGFLSGIQYNFNDFLIFDSKMQTETKDQKRLNWLGMGSKIKITDKLNLEAELELDLDSIKTNTEARYQLGLGYKF